MLMPMEHTRDTRAEREGKEGMVPDEPTPQVRIYGRERDIGARGQQGQAVTAAQATYATPEASAPHAAGGRIAPERIITAITINTKPQDTP